MPRRKIQSLETSFLDLCSCALGGLIILLLLLVPVPTKTMEKQPERKLHLQLPYLARSFTGPYQEAIGHGVVARLPLLNAESAELRISFRPKLPGGESPLVGRWIPLEEGMDEAGEWGRLQASASNGVFRPWRYRRYARHVRASFVHRIPEGTTYPFRCRISLRVKTPALPFPDRFDVWFRALLEATDLEFDAGQPPAVGATPPGSLVVQLFPGGPKTSAGLLGFPEAWMVPREGRLLAARMRIPSPGTFVGYGAAEADSVRTALGIAAGAQGHDAWLVADHALSEYDSFTIWRKNVSRNRSVTSELEHEVKPKEFLLVWEAVVDLMDGGDGGQQPRVRIALLSSECKIDGQ